MGGGSPPCRRAVRTRSVWAEPAGTRRTGRPGPGWRAVRAQPVQPGPEEHRILAGGAWTGLGRRPGLAGRARPAEPRRLQHRVVAGSGRSPAGTGLGGRARRLAGRTGPGGLGRGSPPPRRAAGMGGGSPPCRRTVRPGPQKHRVMAGGRARSGADLGGGTGPVRARPQEHRFLAGRRPRSGADLGGGRPPGRRSGDLGRGSLPGGRRPGGRTVRAGRAPHRLVAGRP